MPALTNPKHERFAQEIAKGSSQREAYATAGYVSTNEAATDASASRLLSDAKVSGRVAELLERSATGTVTSIETLLEAAWGIMKEARSKDDFSAASATLERAAKIAGLWVDQSKQQSAGVVTVFSSEPMTADEWSTKFAPQQIQ